MQSSKQNPKGNSELDSPATPGQLSGQAPKIESAKETTETAKQLTRPEQETPEDDAMTPPGSDVETTETGKTNLSRDRRARKLAFEGMFT